MATEVERLLVRLEADTELLRREMRKAEQSVDKSTKSITKDLGLMDRAFDKMNAGVKRNIAAIGLLGTAYASLKILRVADQFNVLQERIRAATKETGDYTAVSRGLTVVSIETGTALRDNVALFQRVAIGAREFGKTSADILKVTRTVQQLGIIGGASQSALTAGSTQFAQAMAAGVVRAEEMNSIIENIPEVAVAIAEGMGKTVGQLRLAVIEGKVLSEVVFDSLLKQAPKIAKQFEGMPISLERGGRNLSTALTEALSILDRMTGTSAAVARNLDSAGQGILRAAHALADVDLVPAQRHASTIAAQLSEAQDRRARAAGAVEAFSGLSGVRGANTLAVAQAELAKQNELIRELQSAQSLQLSFGAGFESIDPLAQLSGRGGGEASKKAQKAQTDLLRIEAQTQKAIEGFTLDRQDKVEAEHQRQLKRIAALEKDGADKAVVNRVRVMAGRRRELALSRVTLELEGEFLEKQKKIAAARDRRDAKTKRANKVAEKRDLAFKAHLARVEEEPRLLSLTVEQREIELALMTAAEKKGMDLTRVEENRIDVAIRASQAVQAQAEAAEKAAEKAAKEMERVIGRTTDIIVDLSAGAFDKIAQRSKVTWREIASDAVSTMTRAFTQMAAEAFIRPIVQPIIASVVGGAIGGGGSGGGGGGSILGSLAGGVAKSVVTSAIGDAIGLPTIASALGFGAPTAAAAATAAALPGAAVASTAGLAGALPVAGGAAVGPLAGIAAALGPIGIAALIGGGLFLGSKFLGGSSKTPRAGQRLKISGGKAVLGASGQTGGGNIGINSQEAQRAADALNQIVDVTGGRFKEQIGGLDFQFTTRSEAGQITRGAEEIVTDALRVGVIEGVDKAKIDEILANGIDAFEDGLQEAEKGLEETARAADAAARSMETLEAQLEGGKSNLRSFFEGLINPLMGFGQAAAFGDLSAAAPGDRLAAARGQFASTLASAQAGDIAAIQNLPSIGESVIGLGREVFASGPQFASLQQATTASIAGVQAGIEGQRNTAFAEFSIPLVVTMEAQTKTLVGELRLQTTALRDIQETLDRLQAA